MSARADFSGRVHLARALHLPGHMATGIRLVWSSPTPRAPGSLPPAGSPPSPGIAAARALVDEWVCTPFESGAAAIDDLVLRIAAALSSRGLPIAIAAARAVIDDPPLTTD
jgi:hypothetical protein